RQCFPDVTTRLAGSIAQGRSVLEDGQPPDLALIDLGLPDGNGTELIRLIAQRHASCLIVVTTLFGDDGHVFPALRAGAHGYLLKDQPEEKLVAALDGILRGE